MGGRNAVMVIVIVGALIVAGVLVAQQLSGGKKTGDLGQQIYYQCTECNHEFSITVAELKAARDASGGFEAVINCPSCSSQKTRRGEVCLNPDCMRVLQTTGHGQLPSKCPYCGYDFTGGGGG